MKHTVGERIGRLTVDAAFIGAGETGQDVHQYRMSCDCGNEITITGDRIASLTNCGCTGWLKRSVVRTERRCRVCAVKLPSTRYFHCSGCTDRTINDEREMYGFVRPQARRFHGQE